MENYIIDIDYTNKLKEYEFLRDLLIRSKLAENMYKKLVKVQDSLKEEISKLSYDITEYWQINVAYYERVIPKWTQKLLDLKRSIENPEQYQYEHEYCHCTGEVYAPDLSIFPEYQIQDLMKDEKDFFAQFDINRQDNIKITDELKELIRKWIKMSPLSLSMQLDADSVIADAQYMNVYNQLILPCIKKGTWYKLAKLELDIAINFRDNNNEKPSMESF